MKSFKDDFHLDTNRKANITSFGVLGSTFGSLLCLVINDRLGRLRTWRLSVIIWASGLIVQIFSSGIYGLLLFARIWAGIGAGGLTVVTPIYLGEIAPSRSRGTTISIFQVFLLSLLAIGFFVNYGASIHLAATREQYRVVQSIPLIAVGLSFISSFFLPETPRWLISCDRSEEALTVLTRLRRESRSSESTALEFAQMVDEVQTNNQALRDTSVLDVIHEVWTVPKFRSRLIFALLLQTIAQWSGGNGITFYIPQVFEYAGVDGSTSLITSGVYGIVKLVFTMLFTWGLVDIVGRRRSMLTGISLQLISHVWLAIYTSVFYNSQTGKVANKSASDAAIASVFIYAIGWSIGLCTVQYVYATEIFPTRIRSVCYAQNMFLHWAFQFAVVRTTPNMFVSFHIWGAFVFFASICLIGLVVLGLWAPETKGVPMAMMDELFSGKWWLTWRAKVDLASYEEDLSKKVEQIKDSGNYKGTFEQVEG